MVLVVVLVISTGSLSLSLSLPLPLSLLVSLSLSSSSSSIANSSAIGDNMIPLGVLISSSVVTSWELCSDPRSASGQSPVLVSSSSTILISICAGDPPVL